jgi:hypothetical protein
LRGNAAVPQGFRAGRIPIFLPTATSIVQFTFTCATAVVKRIFEVDAVVELRESIGLQIRELSHAQALNNVELSPFGLHWPDLDEDLSFRGIAAGDYGKGKPSKIKTDG